MQAFLCPKCKSEITLPYCKICGNEIKQIEGIYQFTDCGNVNLSGENQYIGYENIGEDFEPCLIYGSNNTEEYGVYSACADLIAKHFGTDITVLDLGAGLGTASIPLAKKGINTIAAD
ncbi:MAG: hypothetical protein IJX55_10365, partial [Clostridia bacterium]|nr:hypothetical protein [Clostridia bacterium]